MKIVAQSTGAFFAAIADGVDTFKKRTVRTQVFFLKSKRIRRFLQLRENLDWSVESTVLQFYCYS